MAAGCLRTDHMVEGLELSVPILDLQGGQGLEVESPPSGQCFNPSCLSDKAPIKPRRRGSESF